MAMAIMVSTWLWLGGVVSTRRDCRLIRSLADRIRGIVLCRPLLLAVDGLASYHKAFQRAFQTEEHLGHKGRPRKYAWSDIAIVQVVKRRRPDGLEIERRIFQGCAHQVRRLRQATQQAVGVINTAYIERLNATFRLRLCALNCRTSALDRQPETLTAGLFIVGCFYNLCETQDSLRLRLSVGTDSYCWVHRISAIAAGLTEQIGIVDELLKFRVPPPRWSPPKRQGRPSF